MVSKDIWFSSFKTKYKVGFKIFTKKKLNSLLTVHLNSGYISNQEIWIKSILYHFKAKEKKINVKNIFEPSLIKTK